MRTPLLVLAMLLIAVCASAQEAVPATRLGLSFHDLVEQLNNEAIQGKPMPRAYIERIFGVPFTRSRGNALGLIYEATNLTTKDGVRLRWIMLRLNKPDGDYVLYVGLYLHKHPCVDSTPWQKAFGPFRRGAMSTDHSLQTHYRSDKPWGTVFVTVPALPDGTPGTAGCLLDMGWGVKTAR